MNSPRLNGGARLTRGALGVHAGWASDRRYRFGSEGAALPEAVFAIWRARAQGSLLRALPLAVSRVSVQI
jgi:hypothetical protein